MICVSIGRGRHRHMIAEHQHLVSQGAQLVELRVDYIQRAVNLRRLIDDRPCPVVITARREVDGGRWSLSEAERLVLIRSAIAEGVEYVDLEEDIAGSIPRFGKTKRIVSLHNFEETPADLEAIHARLAALDADIVKIATMANHPRDNLRMLKLMREATVPTIGLCMGEIGTPSRILAGKFGAPFTYATFSHERALAPGQLSYKQMTQIYRYEEINAETDVYGVIADPVGHSLSPLVHNAALRLRGLNAVYVPFRVPRSALDDFLSELSELGIRGLSVTIPHKEAVLRHVKELDAAVQGIGAANTLVLEQGQLRAFNTDVAAAMDCIDGVFDPEELKGKTALVLGAGGAAKAIVFGLRQRGANVVIASRTLERSEKLAEAFSATAVTWENRHQTQVVLVVNCTPVGMHPDVDDSPVQRHYLKPNMTVFDTVYNPEQTLLIKHARQQNCRVLTGLEMFVRQAALQFEHFTGEDPPEQSMREVVRKAIAAART